MSLFKGTKQVGQILAARVPWVLGLSLPLTDGHGHILLAWTLPIAGTGVAARDEKLGRRAAEEHLFRSQITRQTRQAASRLALVALTSGGH